MGNPFKVFRIHTRNNELKKLMCKLFNVPLMLMQGKEQRVYHMNNSNSYQDQIG